MMPDWSRCSPRALPGRYLTCTHTIEVGVPPILGSLFEAVRRGQGSGEGRRYLQNQRKSSVIQCGSTLHLVAPGELKT